MWKSIANAVLWFFIIIGIFASMIFGAETGGEDGFIAGILGVIATFAAASGIGMLIEMARNIEKIEKNTRNSASTDLAESTAPVQAEKTSVQTEKATVNEQPQKAGWKCSQCGSENREESRFCIICGTRRNETTAEVPKR